MSVWRHLVHPARVVPTAFLGVILLGTLLLAMPWSSRAGHTALIDAAFTAVSATCITGLTSLDTATHWSTAGQVVILALVQVGGFGIMTLTTLVASLLRRRVGLSSTLGTRNEMHSLSLDDVRRLPRRIAVAMLVAESALAAWLTLRFRFGYGLDWASAAWRGVFHAVSAICNAGFALYSDNLIGFVADAWIIFPLCLGIIAGGLGFPVFVELTRRRRFRHPDTWSIHARMTVFGTGVLLALGTGLFALYEWRNPNTLGPLSAWGKVVGSVAGGVFPRTAGFNSIDYAQAAPETLAVNYVLMFIGGGSAGTAGGIKVATFFLLAFVIWSEVRGESDTHIAHRRVSPAVQRQALTVALLSLGVVAIATLIVLADTTYRLDVVLFETISAFGTVGLSTGITPHLPPLGKFTLMVLMFLGRVGPASVATALATNRRHHRYRLPEESPLVG